MMKYKKIVLAGGSGYLGTVLAQHFCHITDKVIILSRTFKPASGNIITIIWDSKQEGEWIDSLEGADAVINLCGKNVNCRYTDKNKQEIITSRIQPTMLLGKVIPQLKQPPGLWVNITSATIYRHAEDRPQDEETGEEGYGFSIDVCRQWEQAFFQAKTPGTRKVALRMGIVFGRNDGVFPRLLNLVRFGLGGRQGDGQQYISWIHEHDAAQCMEWLMQHPELHGIINCTAPEAIKNKDLMASICKAYGLPFGLPAPNWLLELGAVIIGTETELILKSRWVSPKRLTDAGFSFQFSNAAYAVHDILSIRN